MPTPQQQALSAQLSAQIAAVIAQSPQQVIDFRDYMEMALYAPGLGYYMTDHPIFGKEGDFITAPELSPFLAQCLARPVEQVLEKTGGDILEIGAGSGKLAGDLISALMHYPRQYHYYILEISPALRQRQQQYLQEKIPALYSRITWLNELPKKFSGIIIGNEVLDALPVDCFYISETEIFSRGVTYANGQFTWKNFPANQVLTAEIKKLQSELTRPMRAGYYSEVSLMLPSWIGKLSACLSNGAILFLDYGFAQNEFYHPERSQGTLMCHYQQLAQDNPFWYPGLQDITTHVNFTAVAEAGVQHGLTVMGFSSQAQFLLSCGLLDILQQTLTDPANALNFKLKQQVQWLTSPGEMGELFKVMGLAKNCDLPLIGFQDYWRSY